MSRTRQIPPSAASRSQLQTIHPASSEASTIDISGTLRLRGDDSARASSRNQEEPPTRHIRWSEDVIDNEGMGKKSSKGEMFSEWKRV